jgi:hypothetical protein
VTSARPTSWKAGGSLRCRGSAALPLPLTAATLAALQNQKSAERQRSAPNSDVGHSRVAATQLYSAKSIGLNDSESKDLTAYLETL